MLLLGSSLNTLGLFGLAFVHTELWQILVLTTLLGTAFGLAFAAMSNLVVESVPASQTGVANGMNANIRTVEVRTAEPSSPASSPPGLVPTGCRSSPATRTASPSSPLRHSPQRPSP